MSLITLPTHCLPPAWIKIYIYLFDLGSEFLLQRCNLDSEPDQFVIPGSHVCHDTSVTVDCQVITVELPNLLPTSLLLQLYTDEVSE